MLLEIVAQRYILGATELGRGKLLVSQVTGTLNVLIRSHHEQRATTGCTGDDTESLAVTFDIAIDGRVRADITYVNITRKEGLNLRWTGVKRLRLQLDV